MTETLDTIAPRPAAPPDLAALREINAIANAPVLLI